MTKRLGRTGGPQGRPGSAAEGALGAVSKRTTNAIVLMLAAATLSGCVYYNTFYHARAAAREAELLREDRAPDARPSTRETELLERVVEKCGRVLQLHSNSQWADDALLLLGTAHYHQGRYESAEARLNEFIAQYPDSDLRPEAEYVLASVLLARGNPVSAETLLEPVAFADPPEEFSDEALALVGRAKHARKRYDEAAETYLYALDRFPGSGNRAELRYLTAQSHEEAGDLDEAARHYALVPGERGARKLAFESRMRLAEVDLKRDRPDEALTVLDELARRTDDRDELDRVLLLTGSALEATGDYETAVSTYEGISASHKRSEASAQALYRTGLIQRDVYEQLDAATASFRSAKDEAPRSDVATLATDSVRDIEKLKQFLAVIAEHESSAEDAEDDGEPSPARGAEADSADVEPATGAAPFDGAASDSSAVQPERSIGEARADTVHTETVEPDSAGIDDLESGPTDIASAAPDTAEAEAPVDEVAKARFRIAELYLFRFDDPERARGYYTSVVEDHPDSELAPKAALALAWMLESRLEDTDGAREAYRSIAATYAGSEFAAAAAAALERLESAPPSD